MTSPLTSTTKSRKVIHCVQQALSSVRNTNKVYHLIAAAVKYLKDMHERQQVVGCVSGKNGFLDGLIHRNLSLLSSVARNIQEIVNL